jgi:hypothetical protein
VRTDEKKGNQMNWKTTQDHDRQEDLLIFVGLEESAESVFESARFVWAHGL